MQIYYKQIRYLQIYIQSRIYMLSDITFLCFIFHQIILARKMLYTLQGVPKNVQKFIFHNSLKIFGRFMSQPVYY
jgi:hypothetical protein